VLMQLDLFTVAEDSGPLDAAAAGWPGLAQEAPGQGDSSRWSLRYCAQEGCTCIYRACLTGPLNEYCPEHRKEHEYQKVYKTKLPTPEKALEMAAAKWEVVKPDSHEDFAAGVIFDTRELAATLAMGAWEAGMIFRHRGLEYEIVDARRLVRKPRLGDYSTLALRGPDGQYYHGKVDGKLCTGLPGSRKSHPVKL